MNASRFLDTNILLYAYDLDAPVKRAAALRLVEQGWTAPGEIAISVQVLQELHVNLVKRRVSQFEATRIVRDFADWPVVDNTLKLLEAALDEQARWEISLWDSLILAAARASGASELITEDLSHGQNYGGVRAVNPFLCEKRGESEN
jgi:predicted nucleic acid-binding protein